MMSEIQAREKAKKAKEQRERRARKKAERQRKRRKEAHDLAHFEATCPKTKQGIIPRPILSRKAKAPKLPSAYKIYVNLVDKLKIHSQDFQKQQSILQESGTVRWREHRTVGFQGNNNNLLPGNYTLQIRANKTSVWEKFLEIKTSTLENAGLGLFACRPFKRGEVISLYAGVSFDPKQPPKAEYHMQSKDKAIYLDSQGSISKGYPPFLGAHMVNDSTWIPPREMSVPLANCQFNDDFTLAATGDINTNQELLALYNFTDEEETEDEEEEEVRKPAAKPTSRAKRPVLLGDPM
jgi:hypothetical protein